MAGLTATPAPRRRPEPLTMRSCNCGVYRWRARQALDKVQAVLRVVEQLDPQRAAPRRPSRRSFGTCMLQTAVRSELFPHIQYPHTPLYSTGDVGMHYRAA